jgi:hypothetical protein
VWNGQRKVSFAPHTLQRHYPRDTDIRVVGSADDLDCVARLRAGHIRQIDAPVFERRRSQKSRYPAGYPA